MSPSIWDLKGRVLVIAEKPKAAVRIAEALSPSYVKKRSGSVTVYEVAGRNQQIVVASAVGHLYGLHTKMKGYPVYEYEWVPVYITGEGKEYAREYLEILGKLCRIADYYVNACDYDVEGSVIGYLIIKFNGDLKRAFRAKFSALTREELTRAFNNLSGLDYEMVEAGLCRHELDWMWGINVSRALMKSIEEAGGKKITLSAGRVQTPTLKYVIDEISKRNYFIPLPQYTVSVKVRVDGGEMLLEYAGNPVEEHSRAVAVAREVESQSYLVVDKVVEELVQLKPPPPFNLGDLQKEAARIYGFSPARTQSIAEKLYLEALISYPRTNSQKLPPSINYRKILEGLQATREYKSLVSTLLSETRGILKPAEGDKEDPAHPAIYPTGVTPGRLERDEWLVYDLIARRFMAAFALPARIARYTISAKTPRGSTRFHASGQRVVELGWLRYYEFHKPSEVELPRLREGVKLSVVRALVREHYTKPPRRLTKIDILRWMESVEIGTEATRAQIIEKLFERKYLRLASRSVEATELGYGVVEVIEKFFPDLLSVELTRKFEKYMEDIRRGVRERGMVLKEARETLSMLLRKFDDNRLQAGRQLAIRLGIVDLGSRRCAVKTCRREATVKGLCERHAEALRLVYEYYREWSRRKKIEFSEYIEKLGKLKATGRWIKDVIEAGLIEG
ncbi:MAG: DNA topoisomerase I [Desulfurococcus sp.]|nr:DNA topoisomerase I [Desulfurococcus sp.]